MSIDLALIFTGIAFETAIIPVLFWKRISRTLPIFTGYMIVGLLSDCWGAYVLVYSSGISSAFYRKMFEIEMPLDSAIQFLVLIELAWSILRPFRQLRPGRAIAGLSILIVSIGAVIWLLLGSLPLTNMPTGYRAMFHLTQTVSVLRILVFLILAVCSHVLSIGWRDRELQVATGLGFFSVVSLAGTMVHMHLSGLNYYHLVDAVVSSSYAASLIYWSAVFLQREAPRQEFSPHMQKVLITIARAGRMAVEHPSSGKGMELSRI